MILISDGKNNVRRSDLPNSIQNCVDAGVVVHSIAVTQTADPRLVDIATTTGGRRFAYTAQGVLSLQSLFSEIIKGRVPSGSSAAATVRF